jgi:putative hydrolase of the HAD superfamily
MPAAYLLDLYDTLVFADWMAWWNELAAVTGATQEQLASAYDQTRRQRNEGAFESPDAEIRAVLTAGEMPDVDEAVVQRVIDTEASFGGTISLYDDALPTLAAMRAAGIRTALVSNCNRGTRAIVERLGIVDAVDALVLSCELGSAKPDPRIYRAALDALGVESADAVFVDDQTAYCDGARAVGIDTRLIMRPDASPGEGFAPTTNGHIVITELAALL